MEVAAGERPVERLRKADADIRVLQDPLEQAGVTLARKNLKAVRREIAVFVVIADRYPFDQSSRSRPHILRVYGLKNSSVSVVPIFA